MHDLLGLTFQWATGGGDRFSTAIYPFVKLIWQLSNLERAIWQHGKLLWVKCKLLQFFGFPDNYANGLFEGLGWINSKSCVSQNLKIHRFWILLLTWRQRQRVRGRCVVRFTSWCHCIFSCERCHKAELAHSLDSWFLWIELSLDWARTQELLSRGRSARYWALLWPAHPLILSSAGTAIQTECKKIQFSRKEIRPRFEKISTKRMQTPRSQCSSFLSEMKMDQIYATSCTLYICTIISGLKLLLPKTWIVHCGVDLSVLRLEEDQGGTSFVCSQFLNWLGLVIAVEKDESGWPGRFTFLRTQLCLFINLF